jgi:hypothetical protein
VHGGVVFKSDCPSVGHMEIAYTDQSRNARTLKHRSVGRYRQVRPNFLCTGILPSCTEAFEIAVSLLNSC